jgi:glycerate kinase
VISRTVLVAPEAFGEALAAHRVAGAIGRGIQARDATLTVDACPLEAAAREPATVAAYLAAIDFDARMRAARAVVLGAGRLDETTLLGSLTFELATRARQSGVPTYAVTGANALGLFDARVLDLQVVLTARDSRALRRAGERLAELV